jgi:YegS/Rv2252/BmrU family lipid kinase
MPNPRIIVNPIAGRGRANEAKDQIQKIYAREGQPMEMLITTRPLDATQWAYEAARDGVPYVAGAGGDGTANEIINGLARWVRDGGDPGRLPRFGVIPVGTGNDYAYNFFPLDGNLEAHCGRLMRGQTRSVDVGLVESDAEDPLYFVNGVGLGFDAVVNIESRKIKHLRGAAVYVPAVLKTILFYFRAPRCRIALADQASFEDNLMMISVMNGVRFGATFIMTPGSQIDDRVFNFCFVQRCSRPQMFALVPQFIKGTHPGHPKIRLTTARQATLEANEPLPSHVDGEIYSVRARRYTFSILPWQLQMLV